MSDYSSELPIRSNLPGQALPDDVIVKLGDATNPTTQLAKVDTFGSQYVVNADSAGNLIGDQELATTWWLQVVAPSNGPASPGTAAAHSTLAGGIYNSTPPTLTTGQQASLQLDSAGRLLVDATIVFPYDTNYGTVDATTLRTAAQIGNATGAANFNYGAVNAQTLQVAAQLGNATGAIDYNWGTVDAQTIRVAAEVGNATGLADFGAGATTAQTLRVTANQGTPNTAANAWPISITSGGALNSPTNPVYVSENAVPGTTVDDFKDASSIAVNASDTHVYTAGGTTAFYFDQVIAAGSGLTKMLVQVETGVATGIFVTKFVQFNSTADASMDVTLASPILVPTGVRVEVIMTNLDKGAQDLYSTICGYVI